MAIFGFRRLGKYSLSFLAIFSRFYMLAAHVENNHIKYIFQSTIFTLSRAANNNSVTYFNTEKKKIKIQQSWDFFCLKSPRLIAAFKFRAIFVYWSLQLCLVYRYHIRQLQLINMETTLTIIRLSLLKLITIIVKDCLTPSQQ